MEKFYALLRDCTETVKKGENRMKRKIALDGFMSWRRDCSASMFPYMFNVLIYKIDIANVVKIVVKKFPHASPKFPPK